MKLTKKLFIAIMTMALLVVTFGTSTFAWFTLGTESKVEQIKVNVMAGSGMELAQAGKETLWQNNLVLTDGENSTTNNNGEGKLYRDVTSLNGILFKKVVDGAYVDAEAADYLTFVLYVRVSTTAGAVDFDGVMLKSVTGTDAQFTDSTAEHYVAPWKADATFSGEDNDYDEGTPYNFDALNAVKMSFVANNDTEAKFLYGYENSNNQGDVALDGIAKAYATQKDYTLPTKFADNTTTTAPTYMKKANLDAALLEDVTVDTLKAKVTVLASTDFKAPADVFDSTTAAQLDGDNYKYAKLTIRVWLEGWDADCINAILEQETSFQFVLKAWKKETA